MRRRRYPLWWRIMAGWMRDEYIQTTLLAIFTVWLLWKLGL